MKNPVHNIMAIAFFVIAGFVGLVARADVTAVIDGAAKKVTVTVTEGCTNDLSSCANYGDVVAAVNGNAVETFIKAGRGGLYVSADFSSYAGTFDITEGTFLIGSATSLGPVCKTSGSKGCPVYVRNGATLDNAVGEHIGVYRDVYFEGFGVDGVGALVTSATKDPTSNTYAGTWGGRIVMTGDALVADVSADGMRTLCDGDLSDDSYFDMNGHTLYIRAREGMFKFKDACVINHPGDVRPLGKTQIYLDNNLKTSKGDYSGKRFYVGGENTVKLCNTRTAGTNWALVWSNECLCANGEAPYANVGTWDADKFKPDDTTGRRVWRGTVELLTDLVADTRCMNLSFAKAISGNGGIRINSTPIGAHSGPGELHLCAVNSFAGGIVATNTKVTAWVNGAIPAGSSISCSGSSLVFKEKEELSLGSGKFSGSGAMTGSTTGSWSDSLVKEGVGTLTYDSAVGAPLLDVRGGTVALGEIADGGSVVGAAARGLIGGHRFFTSEAKAMSFLTNSTEVCTNLVQNWPSASYDWSDRLWSKFDGETTGPLYVLTYSGYINNPSDAAVNWTFLGAVANMSRLLIDDVEVFVQHKTKEAEIKTVAISPGWHKFNLRLYHAYDAKSDGGAPGGGGTASPTNIVRHAGNVPGQAIGVAVGFMIDRKGRSSIVLDDYELPKDADSAPGTTFRWANLDEDADPVHPITGEHVRSVLSAKFDDLSVAPGTAVSCASPYLRTFGAVTGFTSFTGADVTITESWTIDCADLMQSGATFACDGKVSFAEGTELRIVNPDGYRGHDKVFTVMTAENGIEGMPELVMPEDSKSEWKLSKSDDGKSMILNRIPSGVVLIVR